jgi:predicted flap endonuclease-1-like 5' DNA nuclease
MLFQTPTQWAILALILLLGWVLGLLSRSGGKKWKQELAAERASRAEERKGYEERLRANDARVEASNARIIELEKHAPAAVGASAVGASAVGAAARGNRDDLSAIKGIGADGETRLNDAGYHSFKDIEKMSASDEAALEGRLGLAPGTIDRENWREQAATLRSGDRDGHKRRWFS